MRRVVVLVALVALLAVAVPAQADTGRATTANNSTAAELRERLDDLRQDNRRLKNKNAELKTRVVSLKGRKEKLEDRLSQSNKQTNFAGAETQRLKEMGAWDPYKNEPAFLIWVESEEGGLYQYVGPGNGEHSFNGMNAWTQVLGGDATLLGNVTVELRYAPEGIEKEHTFQSTNAIPKIRQLATKMNQPQTWQAWARWNNQQRHRAETTEMGTMGVTGAGVLVLMFGAMFVESRKDILKNYAKKQNAKRQAAALDRRQYSRLYDLPVIGRVVRWYRDWRRER